MADEWMIHYEEDDIELIIHGLKEYRDHLNRARFVSKGRKMWETEVEALNIVIDSLQEYVDYVFQD